MSGPSKSVRVGPTVEWADVELPYTSPGIKFPHETKKTSFVIGCTTKSFRQKNRQKNLVKEHLSNEIGSDKIGGAGS